MNRRLILTLIVLENTVLYFIVGLLTALFNIPTWFLMLLLPLLIAAALWESYHYKFFEVLWFDIDFGPDQELLNFEETLRRTIHAILFFITGYVFGKIL